MGAEQLDLRGAREGKQPEQRDDRRLRPGVAADAVPVQAVLRDDVARPSLPRDAVLANGPQVDKDLGGFVVPQVIGE